MSRKCTLRESRTDYDYIDNLKDKEIDFSECPEITPEIFARAIVRKGLKPLPRKSQITLRVDADVLLWFRKHGSGYQTQINSLLKAYMHEKIKFERNTPPKRLHAIS